MPQLLLLCLLPLVPLTCLALVLWMDRLEESLEKDVRRRTAPHWRASAVRTDAQPPATSGPSAVAPGHASLVPARVALPLLADGFDVSAATAPDLSVDRSSGGSTKR